MLRFFICSFALILGAQSLFATETDWTLGGGVIAERGEPFPAKVLVYVQTVTKDTETHSQYAWITATVAPQTQNMAKTAPAVIDFTMVPAIVTANTFLSVRVLPSQFERHIDLGNEGSVVIQGVGLQGQYAPKSGRALVRAFVDFAGLRYMAVAQSPDFWGAQFASLGFDTELRWRVRSSSTSIVFSPLIARAGAAAGMSGSPDFKSVLITGEVASRLALEYKTVRAVYAVYAQGGLEGLWLTRPADRPKDDYGEGLATFGFEIRF